jgi:predicted SAM-dependent methyltransferase
MIPFQLHRRIPFVRRPFFQRDAARAEAVDLITQLEVAGRERNNLQAERDALAAERVALKAENDALSDALRHATGKDIAHWSGWCPICEAPAMFRSENPWLRDHLICQSCPGGSIPRERAVMQILNRFRPDWRRLHIHESSPTMRGASLALAKACQHYTPTQFWKDVPTGEVRGDTRCEDIECQTFPDESFDLVVTQDVMEHLFHPERAVREIYRTLKPGGLYLFTTPVYNDLDATVPCAELDGDRIIYHKDAEYHGNPINDEGSLVTFHYARDLVKMLSMWAKFDVEMIDQTDFRLGIAGDFLHVFVCQKA